MFRSAAAASGAAGSPRSSCLVATKVTQQQICGPDPDLADARTPLAACAGGAAALLAALQHCSAAAWQRYSRKGGRERMSTELGSGHSTS